MLSRLFVTVLLSTTWTVASISTTLFSLLYSCVNTAHSWRKCRYRESLPFQNTKDNATTEIYSKVCRYLWFSSKLAIGNHSACLIFVAAGKGDNSTILIAIPIAAVGVLTILVIVILVVFHRRRWVVQNYSIAKT